MLCPARAKSQATPLRGLNQVTSARAWVNSSIVPCGGHVVSDCAEVIECPCAGQLKHCALRGRAIHVLMH